MRNYALPKIQKIPLYNPPLDNRRDFAGLLLDFNEKTVVDDFKSNLYPEYTNLNEKIAEYAGVNVNQVLPTNGSDQGIDIIFRTFTNDGDKVIIPTPSFIIFNQAAMLAGNKIHQPVYRENGEFPFAEVLDLIDAKTKLVLVCNPNNPTGNFVEIEKIEEIVRKANQAIVFIDEAYFEFSRESAVGLIEKYPNVVIARTFSKAFGIPALRIGYLLASAVHIKEMLKVRGPYAVNQAACEAAQNALVNLAEMEEYRKEILEESKPFFENYLQQKGLAFNPSRTNFLLIDIPDAENVAKKLCIEGVRVRPVQAKLRITIGTKQEMQEAIEILEKIL